MNIKNPPRPMHTLNESTMERACLNVSSPKLPNGFQLNLVLGIYTIQCKVNLILGHTSPSLM
jgi:hypothetical protein